MMASKPAAVMVVASLTARERTSSRSTKTEEPGRGPRWTILISWGGLQVNANQFERPLRQVAFGSQ